MVGEGCRAPDWGPARRPPHPYVAQGGRAGGWALATAGRRDAQGGPVAPVLAKVSRHYALDVWCEKVVKRRCRGEACLRRYAGDFVCAFEDQTAAERYYTGRGQRREKFGRARSDSKTRIIPFSRHRRAGKTRFECLGFECRWGKARKGKDHLKRRTARKELRTSLQRVTAWCKAHRHLRLPVRFQRLHAKLRGYDNDYGVHGNAASLQIVLQQGQTDSAAVVHPA